MYWLAEFIARLIIRLTEHCVWFATGVVLLVLAGVGPMPIYGIAHGQIHWVDAYALYGSDTLR
jgi:hypothetical protein